MEDKDKLSVRIKEKTVVMSIVILIIAAIVVFIVPFSYSANAIYDIKEPYTGQECENINLKSVIEWGTINSQCLNQICDGNRKVCVNKNIWGNCVEYRDQCIHYACTKYQKNCNLNIQNIDDVYGIWDVTAYSLNDETKEETFIDLVKVGVQPTRMGTASWQFSYDAGEDFSCRYKGINNPTKTICNDKIKYNTIQKERQIIKKDTLFNMITKRTQYVFYEE